MLGVIPVDRPAPTTPTRCSRTCSTAPSSTSTRRPTGRTLVCGTGRIDGWAVGIVANQRARRLPHAAVSRPSDREMQIGGVIYSDAADKGDPLHRADEPEGDPAAVPAGRHRLHGRLEGRARGDHQGRRQDGQRGGQLDRAQDHGLRRQLVTAPATTRCAARPTGRASSSPGRRRRSRSWAATRRRRRCSRSSSRTAATTSARRRRRSASRRSRRATTPTIDPRYAAARLWVDGIIDPRDTRQVVARSLEVAAHQPEIPPFRQGVLQT